MIASGSERCTKELGKSQSSAPISIFPQPYSKAIHVTSALAQVVLYSPELWRGNSPANAESRALGYYLRPNLFRDFSGVTHVCQKLVMRLKALWKQGLSSQIFLPDSQRLIPGPTESMAKFAFSKTEA